MKAGIGSGITARGSPVYRVRALSSTFHAATQHTGGVVAPCASSAATPGWRLPVRGSSRRRPDPGASHCPSQRHRGRESNSRACPSGLLVSEQSGPLFVEGAPASEEVAQERELFGAVALEPASTCLRDRSV